MKFRKTANFDTNAKGAIVFLSVYFTYYYVVAIVILLLIFVVNYCHLFMFICLPL